MTLLRAGSALKKVNGDETELIGVKIVAKALEAPARRIAENSGVEGSIVVEKIKHMGKNEGFDAVSEQYVDLVEAGIVDPAKVARIALENAASIAGMMLTTEAIVAEKPQKAKPMSAMPPGGPGMGGMGGMGGGMPGMM